MTAREQIEAYLKSWGHNQLIPVRADHLRALLAEYDHLAAAEQERIREQK